MSWRPQSKRRAPWLTNLGLLVVTIAGSIAGFALLWLGLFFAHTCEPALKLVMR